MKSIKYYVSKNDYQVQNWTNGNKWCINDSKLETLFSESIMAIASRFTSAVAAAGLLTSAFALSPPSAHAQDQIAANPPSTSQTAYAPAKPGKHLILRVGKGFSLSAADGLAGRLIQKGCTAEVTTKQGLPLLLGVQMQGEDKIARFTNIGSASSAALGRCEYEG